jgi:hypothetical protein
LEKPVDRVEVELIYSSLKKHPMNNLGQSLYNRDKKTYGIPPSNLAQMIMPWDSIPDYL